MFVPTISSDPLITTPRPINSRQESAWQARGAFLCRQGSLNSQLSLSMLTTLLFTYNIVYQLSMHPSNSYIICDVWFSSRQPRGVSTRKRRRITPYIWEETGSGSRSDLSPQLDESECPHSPIVVPSRVSGLVYWAFDMICWPSCPGG